MKIVFCFLAFFAVNTEATEILKCQSLLTSSRTLRKTISVVLEGGAERGYILSRLADNEISFILYSHPEEFLNSIRQYDSGYLIFDGRHGRSAMLFDYLRQKSNGSRTPTIVIIDSGDVNMAVHAIRSGAEEVLEFPLADGALDAAVSRILDLGSKRMEGWQNGSRPTDPLATLTARERQVLELLFDGHANKTIAHELNISRRTVEVHRASIMSKTQARSMAALVRLVLDAR